MVNEWMLNEINLFSDFDKGYFNKIVSLEKLYEKMEDMR